MATPALRIFSYQPNPRIFKATIAARITGVDIELRGAAPKALADWLWDFDARPLDETVRADYATSARTARTGFGGTLYKTDAFLAAHPYGTVPAAFSADGRTGVFESNSILRAVARLAADDAGLYGNDAIGAARIDSFLDTSLIFARDSQRYLLALMNQTLNAEIHGETAEALRHWLGGIERALSDNGKWITGPCLTLADICFACELVLFANEHAQREQLAGLGLGALHDDALVAEFPSALAHYARLCEHPAFAPDIAPYLEHIRHRAA